MRESTKSLVRVCLTTLGVIAIGVCTAKAQSTRLLQFDDLGDIISVYFNDPNGTVVQWPETYTATAIADPQVSLPNGINVGWNIYEFAGGPLSDTLHLYGNPGGFLNIMFISDAEGSTILPLTGDTVYSTIETGDWQTLFHQTLQDSAGLPIDYTIQIRSDVEPTVPEGGSSLPLMGMGLASLMVAARRFRC